jgi:hypothetical protein
MISDVGFRIAEYKNPQSKIRNPQSLLFRSSYHDIPVFYRTMIAL